MWTEPPEGSLDDRLLLAINGLAGHYRTLDLAMIASARYMPVVFALALMGLWLTW